MLSSLTTDRTLRTGIFLSAALFATTVLMTHSQTVKHGPVTDTSPVSGEQMFNAYCAVCHGKDGKGNGPAATALKTPPPDLSTLAQSHGGKYPATYVQSVLMFGAEGLRMEQSSAYTLIGVRLQVDVAGRDLLFVSGSRMR